VTGKVFAFAVIKKPVVVFHDYRLSVLNIKKSFNHRIKTFGDNNGKSLRATAGRY